MKNGTDLEFVAGRLIMTCCEADMSFAGIICGYPKAYELDNKEWVDVTGIIRAVFDKEAGRELPACRVIDLKKITAPDDEYISMI